MRDGGGRGHGMPCPYGNIQEFGGASSDFCEARFASGCAREVGFGPDEPVANFLIVGEGGVGGGDDGCILDLGWIQEEDGAGFSVVVAIEGNDYRIADAALFFQGGFEVFGIDIQAGGRDDDIFFATAEFQV